MVFLAFFMASVLTKRKKYLLCGQHFAIAASNLSCNSRAAAAAYQNATNRSSQMQVGWGERGGACRVIINWLVMRLLPLPQWGTFSDWLSNVCYMHVQCSHTGTYMYTHTHVRVHTQRHTHTDSGNNTCINPKTLIGLKWTFSISLHCVTFDLHCEKRAQTNSRKTRERESEKERGRRSAK